MNSLKRPFNLLVQCYQLEIQIETRIVLEPAPSRLNWFADRLLVVRFLLEEEQRTLSGAAKTDALQNLNLR